MPSQSLNPVPIIEITNLGNGGQDTNRTGGSRIIKNRIKTRHSGRKYNKS